MKLLLLLSTILTCFAQEKTIGNKAIQSISLVEVLDNQIDEAIYYFEHNWKVYRDVALKRGVIKSYALYKTIEATGTVYLLLITEYQDQDQYDSREENFKQIIDAERPDGPKLLNQKKAEEFRKTVKSYIMQSAF
ncbi:MAG: hypothetical protein KDD94_04855 [Calditrichaeota bacterium]|nr:hypothetical protein [Calditrichota bacterium]